MTEWKESKKHIGVGRANWPWSFDPTWVEECNGFKKKEK